GVNALNAEDLMNYTKISQVHSSCKDWDSDKTTCGQYVNYSYGPEGHENDYDFVSQELVRKLVDLKI
ncbi:Copper homeostasis protein CutC, partial [human gut metagenome]